ncbi:MAG: hypothetical protein IJB48_05390 [Clostridia bacterium]|nr:hypothetical protein [Clostridia bacterium]
METKPLETRENMGKTSRLRYLMEKVMEIAVHEENSFVNDLGDWVSEPLARRIRATQDPDFLTRVERGIPKMEAYFREKTDFDCDRIASEEMIKIFRWATQFQIAKITQNPDLRPTRGLLIIGPAGRGKTKMLEKIYQFSKPQISESQNYWQDKSGRRFAYTPPDWHCFQTINADSIARKCKLESVLPGYAEYLNSERTLLLDDVGSEPQIKFYGNEPVMKSFLMDMYNEYRKNGKLVIMTSNLSMMPNEPHSFLGFYGDRVFSRLCEMFDVVKFTNCGDMRQEREALARQQQASLNFASVETTTLPNYEPAFNL